MRVLFVLCTDVVEFLLELSSLSGDGLKVTVFIHQTRNPLFQFFDLQIHLRVSDLLIGQLGVGLSQLDLDSIFVVLKDLEGFVLVFDLFIKFFDSLCVKGVSLWEMGW